jgi:ketosteroid isomerase-like protein
MSRALCLSLTLAAMCAVTSAAPNAFARPAQATHDPDEKMIRDAVARLDAENRVERTEDSIFWSGQFKRPSVRGQSPAERTSTVEAAKRESTKTKTTIERLEISQSRDMAYEFSTLDLVARELDASRKMADRAFKASTLRVWKKVNGQWHVAASFTHAHEP